MYSHGLRRVCARGGGHNPNGLPLSTLACSPMGRFLFSQSRPGCGKKEFPSEMVTPLQYGLTGERSGVASCVALYLSRTLFSEITPKRATK